MYRCKKTCYIMLHYKKFVVSPIEENCYVLWDDASRECAIVDCGAWTDGDRERICHFIDSENIVPVVLLQTHMHFDHCLGLGFMAERYGLVPLCHALDLPIYQMAPAMVQRWFRKDIAGSMPEADASLTEGTVLKLGDIGIQVLLTPGHTPGGVSFYIPEARIVLTGDTLFRMSVGRTDLPGGDMRQETDSIISKLFTLPPDTTVLPGHGPESSIGEEHAHNPYLIGY